MATRKATSKAKKTSKPAAKSRAVSNKAPRSNSKVTKTSYSQLFIWLFALWLVLIVVFLGFVVKNYVTG